MRPPEFAQCVFLLPRVSSSFLLSSNLPQGTRFRDDSDDSGASLCIVSPDANITKRDDSDGNCDVA